MESRTVALAFASIFAAFFGAETGAAALVAWSVNDTRHVLRSERPGQRADVEISGARNEWVSFQVFVRSDAAVAGLRLEAGDLAGESGSVLKGTDAVLYREHQLRIDTGTYRNDDFKPDWYPDPLIPFAVEVKASDSPKRRIVAVPFDVPANETHGFWVDIYIPTNARPGAFVGAYRLIAANQKPIDVPVRLQVWDFTLPQTPAMATEFGSPAQRLREYLRKHGDGAIADWKAVEAQCADLMTAHRINAPPPPDLLGPVAKADGSFEIPAGAVDALRTFVDRHHLNAIPCPHPRSVVSDPVAQSKKLRGWLAAFDRAAVALNRSNVTLFVYLKDEPNTKDAYEYVQRWGRAIRDARSVVKVLVVEQPWTAPGAGGADSGWGDLYGAVDIWCPLFSLHQPESTSARIAMGEKVWTYTALCQRKPTPWWHIDYPLLNYRVPAWMAWRDGISGLLYWGGMSYWSQTDDPWTAVPIYTGKGVIQQGKKGLVYNGEGSLVYPAAPLGFNGLVPTIRLKALRDGIEDYEYFAMAERLGKRKEAEQIVRALTSSFYEWNKDPGAYERARADIAKLIAGPSK